MLNEIESEFLFDYFLMQDLFIGFNSSFWCYILRMFEVLDNVMKNTAEEERSTNNIEWYEIL